MGRRGLLPEDKKVSTDVRATYGNFLERIRNSGWER